MQQKLRGILQSLLWEEQGAASVEYALLAALIAVVIAGSVGVLGRQVCGIFANLSAMFGGTASNGNTSC